VRSADPAAVTKLWLYRNLTASQAEVNRPELAGADAIPAAVTKFRFNPGQVPRPGHNWQRLHHCCLKSHAVMVAVADSTDKGGYKGPHGVNQAFLFQLPEVFQGLFF